LTFDIFSKGKQIASYNIDDDYITPLMLYKRVSQENLLS
jgi:hypothetical protein